MTTSTTGCIGRMATAGIVGKFNLEVVEGKWAREGVFLLLYIIPVYPIAGAIDLIIVNSIEFHTGKNPISGQDRLARAGERRDVIADDGTRVVSTLRHDGSIDLEITSPDGFTQFANLRKQDGRVIARDVNGKELASLLPDGRVEQVMRAFQ
jgi:hypothetical protein